MTNLEKALTQFDNLAIIEELLPTETCLTCKHSGYWDWADGLGMCDNDPDGVIFVNQVRCDNYK